MFINLDEPDLAGKPVRFVSKLMFRETGSLSIWYLFREVWYSVRSCHSSDGLLSNGEAKIEHQELVISEPRMHADNSTPCASIL